MPKWFLEVGLFKATWNQGSQTIPILRRDTDGSKEESGIKWAEIFRNWN